MVKSAKKLNTSDKKSSTARGTKRTATVGKKSVVTSKKYTNMFAAYRAFWARGFTDWTGTTSRAEYWWTALANLLIIGLIGLVLWLISVNGISNAFEAFAGISMVWAVVTYCVAAIIPSISMILRRLHDGGFSSWWILLYPVAWLPYVGNIAALGLLILMLMPTRKDGNPYHENKE